MGVTTSSRFRQDAEFLLRKGNIQRLEQLMAKHAQRILEAKSSYNLLVRLCEEGHSEALVFAVELSRKALTHPNTAALRDMRSRLQRAFGATVTPETVASHILTFVAVPRMNRMFGSSIVPRVDHSMPFLIAAENGHWEVIKWMCQEAGVNVLAQDNRTGFGLLHACCKGGQTELLDHLLSWDLQIPTDRGLAPLHSSWHRSPDDGSFAPWVDVFAKGGVTPLMVAAFFGHDNCVQLLLQRGASLRYLLRGGAAIPLPSGSSTLHCAARGGSSAVALSILKGLYTSAGGILPADEASNETRAPWEGNSQYDLRARENNIGLKPFKYASLMEGTTTHVERMLHPALPLALVIRQSDPEWRGHEGGVPRLYAIALTALRESLLSQLHNIETAGISNRDLPDAPATSSLRCLPPDALGDALHSPQLAAMPEASFTTTTNPCASHAPYLVDAASEQAAAEDALRSPTFAYNPTFEPMAIPSHSSSRCSLDPTFEPMAIPSHSSSRCSLDHHDDIEAKAMTVVLNCPPQAAPSFDISCSTPSHSKDLSELSSFESVCSALSLLRGGYAAPSSIMKSDPEVLEGSCADVQKLKAQDDCAECLSISQSFELPVLDAAGSPAAMRRAEFAMSSYSQQISESDSHECHDLMPSTNEAFANIARAQEMGTSPSIASPVQVLSSSTQNLHRNKTCRCEAHCETSCSSVAPQTAHMDPCYSFDVRRRSTSGSVYTVTPVSLSIPHRPLTGAAQVDIDHLPGGVLGTTATPNGAVATPHFATIASSCMVRRHTLHGGDPCTLVSYPEVDEEEEVGNHGPAVTTSAGVSVFGRMLAAVDVSSCLSPAPADDEPVPALTHRCSMPSNDSLAAHWDRSFTDTSGNHPRPLSGSVSMSRHYAGYSAGSAQLQSEVHWNLSAPGELSNNITMASNNTTMAGYSSDNAAFLSSQHRGRGFASFRQSLRRSLKSLSGLSRGRESNCGDGADATAVSDDDMTMPVCPICMDADVAVSVQSCSHSLCVDCARQLCTSAVKPVQCPLCRITVNKFVKLGSV